MPVVGVKRYQGGVQATPLPNTQASIQFAQPDGIGEALTRVGLQAYKDELQRQDQVQFLAADRQASEWEQKALHDPKDGALARKGRDAFGAPDEVLKKFDERMSEIDKTLTTQRQRDAFARSVEARRRDINSTLSRHVFQEARAFENAETESYIKTAQQSAILNHDNPERVDIELSRATAAVADHARRNGLGPEYVKQRSSQIVSDTHVGIINRYLSNGHDQAARDHFDQAKKAKLIAGDDIAKLEASVKSANTAGEGLRGADSIWQKHGPRRDLDPVNLDAMMKEAREKFSDKPEVLKAIGENLRERTNTHNASARERREANSSAVWRMIDAGTPMAKIAMSPEFQSLPGEEARRIREHVVDRARAEATRAEAQGDDSLYYQLITEASSPALRDQFMQRNLHADRAKLGKAYFHELSRLQASMRSGDDKSAEKLLASERQQARMVDEALIGMRLDPTPNEKTSPEKAKQTAEFRRAVREAVRSLETRTGKNATDADVQGIVDGLVIQGVTKEHALWVNETKRVYQLQPGEGIKIKVTDVPRAEKEKIEDALRRANAPISDDAIVRLYTTKLLEMRGGRRPRGSGASGSY